MNCLLVLFYTVANPPKEAKEPGTKHTRNHCRQFYVLEATQEPGTYHEEPSPAGVFLKNAHWKNHQMQANTARTYTWRASMPQAHQSRGKEKDHP